MRQSAAVVFTVVLVATQSHAQPLSFYTPAYEHAAIAAPRSIVSADFNRDGFPDVALGGTGRDSVGILLHHGLEEGDEGQRFKLMREVVVGGGPFELAAADLNRDGWPDIAIANADLNAVTILLNARGSFTTPKIDVPVTQNPRGLAIADINRDGAPDLVVTKYLGSSVEILFGAGNGTFPTRRSHSAPANSQGVATADFDNNGWIDFVVVSAGGTIAQYANDATRTTRTDRPGSTPWNVVTVGDFDIDGRQDVAAASTSESVARIFYRSGGSSGAIPTAASPRGIEAADLDRDGVPELVLAGRASSTVSVLSRQPDGTYRHAEFPAGRGARDLVIVDHDRGGALDILTANEYGDSLSVLFNTLRRPAAYAFDPVVVPDDYYNSAYAVADFNHNGRPDVVRERGVLLDGTTHVPLIGNDASWAGAADVNGDGHADAIFAARATLQTFLGDGAGGFTAGPTTGTSWSAGILRTADMNRDGRMDVVLSVNTGSNNAIEVWTGTGTGRFIRYYHADTYAANALDLADVDLNGTLDILVTSGNGVVVFLCDSTGAAIDAKWFDEGSPRYGLAVGLVNHDGTPDIIVSKGTVQPWGLTSGTRVGVALGNGDGTFREVAEHDLGRPDQQFDSVWAVFLGDLNHDSVPDLLTSNGALLFGSSDGTLSEPQWFGVSVMSSAVMAELTGDGLTDVIGVTMDGNQNAPVIMTNTLRQPSENRAPIGIALPERGERPYADFFDSDDQWDIYAGDGYDPDLHLLRFRWTTGDGRVFGTERWSRPALGTGVYQLTVTADDGRGGFISDTMEFEITPHMETVFWASQMLSHGAWEVVADSSAASGNRLFHPDAGAPKSTAPLPDPVDYLEIPFLADKTQVYKLWVRLKAERNYWGNDSVWVQVTGAKDQAGNPLYEIGSSSGLAVNLEECANCGISGWGWEDDGWGDVNRNGVLLHFPEGGVQTLRIQTREDGVSIDQIVLSAARYRTARPGSAKNDNTKLEPAGPVLSWW